MDNLRRLIIKAQMVICSCNGAYQGIISLSLASSPLVREWATN